jgi:hypothetical protein
MTSWLHVLSDSGLAIGTMLAFVVWAHWCEGRSQRKHDRELARKVADSRREASS